MANIGMYPLLLSKVLPSVLGIVASLYCFRVCMQIFPVPVAAFASTLLLNQAVWMNDDLASASPRAFVSPLFLAFFTTFCDGLGYLQRSPSPLKDYSIRHWHFSVCRS
ncbi:MAG: hypothetical protein PUP93_23280 [Rhizonema sp. NSF051]|nr:hypothetical protein [Rhizonema sp. NSF051]